MEISENKASPWTTRERQFGCPHCQSRIVVPMDWLSAEATLEEQVAYRQRMQERIKLALDEHRRVCTGADAIEGRVYQIDFPRA